jgi:uncharacterized membrane protein
MRMKAKWRRLCRRPPRLLLGLLGGLALVCSLGLLASVIFSSLDRLPRGARLGMVAVAATSHAALYLGLAGLFGRSLLSGRTPLVTMMADRIHGPLTPRIRRYTRRVTMLWTLFALGQLATSALLMAFAPLRIWSLFVTGLDLPLVLLLFTGEFTYRCLRYPRNEVGSLGETIRVTRDRMGR